MPTVSQSDNKNISLTATALDSDEFVPLIRVKGTGTYNVEGDTLNFTDSDPNKREKVTLSEYIDGDKQTFDILQLTTENKTIKLPFNITKGNKDSDDENGIITVRLSEEVEGLKITSEQEFKASYGSSYNLELELEMKESKAFFVDFYAKDDYEEGWWWWEDDVTSGKLTNIHCGRVKVVLKMPNEWEFSTEKIEEIKAYALANNSKFNGPGDANKYHHCTDTHKHIIYKLLDSPNGLDLGKDQNHEAIRNTPKDFEKAGESTTHGVRNKLIASTYAEPSKVFTVVDINDKEVLNPDGTAGNTDNEIKKFKNTPIEWMKGKCPDDGFYVFFGAYNDDYHSFTIIVKKNNNNFAFNFIDQLEGVLSLNSNKLENRFLSYIEGWKSNYPMNLRLYQLRNKKK